MNADDHPKETTSLCLNCGLCCDGTIFADIPVYDSDDIRPLQAACVRFIAHSEMSLFEQPCPAYVERSCLIYSDRPAACREFSCKLFDEVDEQKITLAEAQHKINQVISLRQGMWDSIKHITPSLPGIALAKLWQQWNSLATGEEGLAYRQKLGTPLIQMAALRWYLWQHFYGEPPDRS